jgi:hypothetical protein
MADQAHHPECWRDPKHHACAVRQVERLRDALIAYVDFDEIAQLEGGGFGGDLEAMARRALGEA